MLDAIIALSMTLNTSAPQVAAVPARAVASSVTAGDGEHAGGDWSAAPAVTAPTGTGSDQEADGVSADPAPVTAPAPAGDHEPDGDSAGPATGQSAPASSSSVGTSTAAPAPSATYTGGSSFQQCVISRESGGNPTAVNPTSGAGGLYQFLPSTWASLGYSGLPQNAPVSVQNQAFAKLYAQAGTSPWAPYDGC